MQASLTQTMRTAASSFGRLSRDWARPAARSLVTKSPSQPAAPQAASQTGAARKLQTVSAVENGGTFPESLGWGRGVSALKPDLLANIDLIVYDMAGTTVEEGGIVYKTLQAAMVQDGLQVPDEAMHPWHGAKKEAVIEHFARQAGTPDDVIDERVTRIGDWFVGKIEESYFSPSSPIDVIDSQLMTYFDQLKQSGIKIGFDTGYPPNIQEGLIDRLGFDKVADAYVSSYQVAEGRPFPYMIYRIMERTGVMDVKRVCKVGDSVRDIEEGRNAGCGLVVGVLSGADTYEEFIAAGADIVCNNVTELPVPHKAMRSMYVNIE